MTKEPIMIDDVDVSGCRFYEYQTEEDLKMRYPNSGDCEIGLAGYLFDFLPIQEQLEKHCIDNPNCYYKQLKRKEQECEELRGGQRDQNKVIRELIEKTDQLEERLNDVLMVNYEGIAERYKQALQEIKDYCNKYPQNSIGFKKQILQKCEVINEKV